MPELPEVETIRRRLAPVVEGRVLERVDVLDPRWSQPLAAEAMEEALTGRRVVALGRRGKSLVWRLDDGTALLVPLRMTGTLLYAPPAGLGPGGLPAHSRVRLGLDDGHVLAFVDPRRFGT